MYAIFYVDSLTREDREQLYANVIQSLLSAFVACIMSVKRYLPPVVCKLFHKALVSGKVYEHIHFHCIYCDVIVVGFYTE